MAGNVEDSASMGPEVEGDVLMDSNNEQELLANNPALQEAARQLRLSMDAPPPTAPLGEKAAGDATTVTRPQ